MKKLAVLPVALLIAFGVLYARSQDQPKSWTKTYSLLPAQTLNIVNREAKVMEMRSEYPVQLAAGDCHNDYTVQWSCHWDQPTDVFLRDLRTPPVFSTPRANTITVTFTAD